MNQEQNNWNQYNFNTQGNTGETSNQSLNNCASKKKIFWLVIIVVAVIVVVAFIGIFF